MLFSRRLSKSFSASEQIVSVTRRRWTIAVRFVESLFLFEFVLSCFCASFVLTINQAFYHGVTLKLNQFIWFNQLIFIYTSMHSSMRKMYKFGPYYCIDHLVCHSSLSRSSINISIFQHHCSWFWIFNFVHHHFILFGSCLQEYRNFNFLSVIT